MFGERLSWAGASARCPANDNDHVADAHQRVRRSCAKLTLQEAVDLHVLHFVAANPELDATQAGQVALDLISDGRSPSIRESDQGISALRAPDGQRREPSVAPYRDLRRVKVSRPASRQRPGRLSWLRGKSAALFAIPRSRRRRARAPRLRLRSIQLQAASPYFGDTQHGCREGTGG